MPSKQSNSQLDNAAVLADGAFIDGRLRNIGFKHKQLRNLFGILQENGDTLINATTSSSTLAFELQDVLSTISEAIAELPSDLVKAAKALRTLVNAKSQEGRKSFGCGTVLIVADSAHAVASWAVPLVAAIMDGNAAIITHFDQASTVFTTISKALRLGMDQDAFHFLEQDPTNLVSWLEKNPPGLIGCVSLGQLASTTKASLPVRNFTIIAPFNTHNPVIIDQLIILSSALQEMARTQGTSPIPDIVQDIVASIAQAHHTARGGEAVSVKKSHKSLSSGLPSYVLVHENISSLVITALESVLPSHFRPHRQDLSAIEDVVASKTLDYLPVFVVRSIDHAMDTINNRLSSSHVAYVFGEERFGVYAAHNLRQKIVAINDIPKKLTVNGAYASRKDFSIVEERSFYVAKKPTRNYEPSSDAYKKLKVTKLRQSGGFRIDFFGGSFLFAAGIFLSCFLGGSGWAVYRGSLLALAKWRGL